MIDNKTSPKYLEYKIRIWTKNIDLKVTLMTTPLTRQLFFNLEVLFKISLN